MSDDYAEVTRALAARIVRSYLLNNQIAPHALPPLIESVHAALHTLGAPPPKAATPKPATAISRSVTPDHIVCLEDGLRLKSLRRHLRAKYNMTPEEYRTRWGLPADYPMVAPNYSRARSELARATGFGKGVRPGRGRKPKRPSTPNGQG